MTLDERVQQEMEKLKPIVGTVLTFYEAADVEAGYRRLLQELAEKDETIRMMRDRDGVGASTSEPSQQPLGDGVQLLAWAVSNCHTLARRRLKAGSDDAKWWQHVLRICEKAGAKSSGVLRASIPTEITDGSASEAHDGDWRLVRVGEVGPRHGGHGSWVETDHPAVVDCMGSGPECAAGGCQYQRVLARAEAAEAEARRIRTEIQRLLAKPAKFRVHNARGEYVTVSGVEEERLRAAIDAPSGASQP